MIGAGRGQTADDSGRMAARTAARHARVPGERAGQPGRRVLPVIMGLLLASGVMRLGGDGLQALAVESPTQAAAELTEDHPAEICAADPDTAAMLEAFRTRESRIESREAQLADRMQQLQVAEAEIDGKLTELRLAQSELAATLALSESAAEDDLTRLTAVYENMKPEDTAALFAQMAPEFAAGFVGRMKPEAAAPVMSRLDPATAYSISAIMAGRNAAAPTE